MPRVQPTLEDRFVGCLLGLAVGDALGSHFEGQPEDFIARRYPTIETLIQNPPLEEMWYTDDTRMAIGVAETLAACGSIDEAVLCQRFAANYAPHRGYGRGARRVLQAMVDGENHKWLAESLFPGGSLGNGGAMRVGPVGVMFHHDVDRLWSEARLSALPTHVHPLGIEGAQVLALAVGLATRAGEFNREEFFDMLTRQTSFVEYAGPLRRAAQLQDRRDLGLFGNGIEATASVVTAIAAFSLAMNSYTETIGSAILLGGDTDTIAAMAGAISGAYLGSQAIPPRLLKKLENGPQGRNYIHDLAKRLHAAHEELRSPAT
jgi:poly(ADP-ribose) glycohydrolase ARH3